MWEHLTFKHKTPCLKTYLLQHFQCAFTFYRNKNGLKDAGLVFRVLLSSIIIHLWLVLVNDWNNKWGEWIRPIQNAFQNVWRQSDQSLNDFCDCKLPKYIFVLLVLWRLKLYRHSKCKYHSLLILTVWLQNYIGKYFRSWLPTLSLASRRVTTVDWLALS